MRLHITTQSVPSIVVAKVCLPECWVSLGLAIKKYYPVSHYSWGALNGIKQAPQRYHAEETLDIPISMSLYYLVQTIFALYFGLSSSFFTFRCAQGIKSQMVFYAIFYINSIGVHK